MPLGAAGAIRGGKAPAGSQTFAYTGAVQYLTVPRGVYEMTLDLRGGEGGYGHGGTATGPPGGKGERLQATIPVTPYETLAVYIGQKGPDAVVNGAPAGGWNGGGPGGPNGPGWWSGGSGAGASDIRRGGTALGNRIAVAAGAGAGGAPPDGLGGDGGGLTGADGVGGGYGATQTAGGASGGAPATAGSLGQGGSGATGHSGYDNGGGGGGGGLYGGGGGPSTTGGPNGAGGGGSDFIETEATDVTHTRGYQTGDGALTVSWN